MIAKCVMTIRYILASENISYILLICCFMYNAIFIMLLVEVETDLLNSQINVIVDITKSTILINLTEIC